MKAFTCMRPTKIKTTAFVYLPICWRSLVFLLLCNMSQTSVAADMGKTGTRLSIFVSILPQKYLVERIGQQYVNVSTMVGPGRSPDTYEPTPKQMSLLSSCDAYLRIGVPFENMWIDKIGASNSRLKIFDMDSSTHDSHHHDDGSGIDPHIWTNPVTIRHLAQQTSAVLAQLDPAHKDKFASNLLLFETELSELDQFIKQTIHDKKIKHFMVYHPAWGHFAQQYGLVQIAIEKDGKEPGAKNLTQLIAIARHNNIHRIFVQPQFNRRSAEIIARAINAEIVVVDPLAENVIENIKDFTRKLAQGT